MRINVYAIFNTVNQGVVKIAPAQIALVVIVIAKKLSLRDPRIKLQAE